MNDTRARGDEVHMRRALELARKGWGQTAPNPMVGAVVVRDGAVIGEGWHERFGESHAEVNALRVAGNNARDADLYVTLEPCRHHGKTPPCTDAIIASGIRRVVYAVADPTSIAQGGGDVLRAAGIDVSTRILQREARELNAAFFHAASGATTPWVTLKLAVSMEMAIAGEGGTTSQLTSAPARAAVHELRAGHDAIAVGIGTVLADDPQLTVRGVRMPRVPLKRVVFDRTLRIPTTSALVRTAAETPTIVVTQTTSSSRVRPLRDAGVQVVPARDLAEGMHALRQLEVRSLLVEGGASFASAVLEAALVHRLIIFQAPVALGSAALHAFDGASPRVLGDLERYTAIERRQLGPDVMTTYVVRER